VRREKKMGKRVRWCASALYTAVILNLASGCLPVDARGTIFTPAPTEAVTPNPEEPPVQAWEGMRIPAQCVKPVPRGLAPTFVAMSPDGRWILYEQQDHNLVHSSLYNLETGELRNAPRNWGRFDSFQWDERGRGLYALDNPGLFDLAPADRKIYWLDPEALTVQEVRDCPYCTGFDVNEKQGVLVAQRSFGQREYQLDVVGWQEPFTNAVTVDRWRGGSYGAVILSPGAKRVGYRRGVNIKEDGVLIYALSILDLRSGVVITSLAGSSFRNIWLSDDVVLEPDLRAARTWKRNLQTGSRTVFAEFAPEVFEDYRRTFRTFGGGEPRGIYRVMIGNDGRFMLFRPRVNNSGGILHAADLWCSRRVERATS
jgi:hypothetical protein